MKRLDGRFTSMSWVRENASLFEGRLDPDMRKTSQPDALDLKILRMLAKDARIAKADLAEKVGLSPSPCHERMKKLERSKIIQGYHARIDYRRLANYSFFITLVKISNYTTLQVKAFERLALEEPAVMEMNSLLGETDYLLKIAARGIEEYQAIVEKLFRSQEFTVQFITHAVSGELRSVQQAKLIDTCQPGRD